MRTCYFCKGEIIEEKIQHVHQWGEKIVIFEDVPAEVCQQCGETYFSPEVLEKMDAVTNGRDTRGGETVSTVEWVDDLVSVTECFAEAESRGKEIYDRPEQARWREQLPRLLKVIFANSEFHAKLTPKERIAFYNDYTRGIATLLLKGDCQPLFEDMEEWYEYLEELVDYDEFEAGLKEEHNLILQDIELA